MRAAVVALVVAGSLLVLAGTGVLVRVVLHTHDSATVACDIQARGLEAQKHLEQALHGAVLTTSEARYQLRQYWALESKQPTTRTC